MSSSANESSINPYAAPVAPVTRQVVETAGIWRQGDQLVMHRGAVLPDVCVRSNEPGHGFRLKRKLSWHHPAVYIALISPIIYVILAAILQKRATIEIGLNDHWRGVRIRRMWIAGLLVLAGLATFFGAFFVEGMLPPRSGVIPLMIFGGMLIGVVGAAVSTTCRMLKVAKIDDHYVYLKGLHPEFLDRFESISPTH